MLLTGDYLLDTKFFFKKISSYKTFFKAKVTAKRKFSISSSLKYCSWQELEGKRDIMLVSKSFRSSTFRLHYRLPNILVFVFKRQLQRNIDHHKDIISGRNIYCYIVVGKI